MTRSGVGIYDRLADRNALRRWSKIANSASETPLDQLRLVRARGKELQKQISRVVAAADERSMFQVAGANLIRTANNADWTWRPDVWKTLATESGSAGLKSGDMFAGSAKFFHDCDLCENAVRQVQNSRSVDLAAFGLRLDFLGFTGSFFSVVLDLPASGLTGLSKQHVIRADIDIVCERNVTIFARLNLKQGPNTETLVVEIGSDIPAIFDLGYSDVSENHVDAAWLELILENPCYNEIIFRDLTLCRHPRAEI